MAQDDLFQPSLTVEPENEKHLARNVPGDLPSYRKRVDFNLRANDKYDRLRPEKQFIQDMAKALADDLCNDQLNRLTEIVSGVWLRYEVVSRSVDFRVSPPEVYLALKSVSEQLQKAIGGGLRDDHRDQVVAEDRGLSKIEEFNLDEVEFNSAATLAEKVTISRLKLQDWLGELEVMKQHFNYKRSMVRRGKPGQYSLPYAVMALADFYALENDRGDKATVNLFTERHTGRFLEFVRAFFRVVDPRIANLAGDTFPEAVRKIAQRRSKDPDCYKLLDGDSTTQDMLDFMGRVDKLRT